MPGDGELTGPAGYASTWLVVAAALVGVVVLYYWWVWQWSRAEEKPPEWAPPPKDNPRDRHLAELRRIEASVKAADIPVRVGFQRLSLAVRSFTQDVTGLPARAMTLSELEGRADPRVVDAVAEMYPPEFAPEAASIDDFARSLKRARELMTSWT